jgi:lysozyme family protein
MIHDVIRREGGFVDHPADRGGPTKFGITQKTLSRALGRQATTEDVRRLTREIAAEIYRRTYYTNPPS